MVEFSGLRVLITCLRVLIAGSGIVVRLECFAGHYMLLLVMFDVSC
jgi:hypothetical protein